MELFSDTTFWVAAAFFVFVGILIYVKVPATVTALLDKRSATIKAELDQARALREEAFAALSTWKTRQAEAASRADQVLADAKAEAQALAAQAAIDLDAAVARRTQQALDRIAQAEQKAAAEVRAAAVDAAIAAARDVIAKSLGPAEQAALIDKAIADTGRRLH
ncbi:F0F1 ATP synthase subunit B family protein [Zavarzinia sp. CC-PAN008]|uniref:F0F1 ATP synthase subunit B family protein n=1 Tax=Zavarzinia sp. CC-PAN008 TaxID=3243332 RepID=UPI003F748AF7